MARIKGKQRKERDDGIKKIDFSLIEKKWQEKWEKAKCFQVKEDKKKKKYYVLEMYPYPSASFLHMGHVRNFTIGDVYARLKRMQGFNVLYPMGYDSFGLPAETAAKKAGIHPSKYTEEAIKKITEYFKALGNSYDWSRTLASHDPDYYKWNQYFFLKLLEKGLAYRKKAPVNWCETCQSVLANEESEGGKCWRCNNEVIKKDMEQWFFKITDYADRLLDDLSKIEWPEKIKTMQRNWIGKSHGTEIDFEIPAVGNMKDNEFVFFHAFKDNSRSVFWPWLKKEIEARGGKVAYAPDLPKPDEPNISEWVKLVQKEYNFNEKTVLITHSLGGVLAMKLLPEIKNKIKKLIMVAPPASINLSDGKRRPALEKCCDWRFDFEKIKEKTNEIVVLADEKDHLIRVDSAMETAKKLSAKCDVVIAQAPHFNSEEEPRILDRIVRKWPVFTTRPDTIYGVTFMVISAGHPKLMEIVTDKQKKEVEEFVKRCQKARSPEEIESLEKDGVFTGNYAINPLTKEKIPIYAGNFVIADYGSGMVMAVPAHDQRDFDFAKKYKIPVKVVINSKNEKSNIKEIQRAFTDEGVLINSDKFDGLNSKEAIKKITEHLIKQKAGRWAVNYKIRDWMISRQRYWGTPIPVIYCDKCGVVPVNEKELPVLLPEKVDFKSAGNPLNSNKEWVNAKCPKCHGKARREIDTMGGFMDSSWYFLRYCDNLNKKKAFSKERVDYWMPVDQYVGGAEHAVMHLMYARFFVKALKDLGFVEFDEPFKRLFNQGIVYKDGAKMSKSYGNVVFQTDISNKYGIDTVRMFLMVVSAPDKQMEWSDEGVEGSFRAINRLIKLSDKVGKKADGREEHKINLTIRKMTRHIESFDYPKAIISFVECMDSFSEGISREGYMTLLKLISPFCPHVAEEMWEKVQGKGFVSVAVWPKADETKINMGLEQAEKNVEKIVADILNVIKIVREGQGINAERVYLYVIPNEVSAYNAEAISKRIGKEVSLFAVNDNAKYDPYEKSSKAKPGKPAIYVE